MISADGRSGSRRFCVIYVGGSWGFGEDIVAADVSVVELDQVESRSVPGVYIEHDQPVSHVRVHYSLDEVG